MPGMGGTASRTPVASTSFRARKICAALESLPPSSVSEHAWARTSKSQVRRGGPTVPSAVVQAAHTRTSTVAVAGWKATVGYAQTWARARSKKSAPLFAVGASTACCLQAAALSLAPASRRMTERVERARTRAADSPAGPAPTTMTSASGVSGGGRGDSTMAGAVAPASRSVTSSWPVIAFRMVNEIDGSSSSFEGLSNCLAPAATRWRRLEPTVKIQVSSNP